MQVRSGVWAGQREEGFSLIELLVAISLIGIIMSGLAFGITNSLTITRDSRERTIAANLASAEIDLAQAAPINNLQEGTLRRVERVGTTDFTIERESGWQNGVSEAEACTALANSASGRGRRFLEVNVTVTWDGLGLRGPVRASTAITPSVASYRAGFGHVAVTVTDRDAQALQAITVTLTGEGITRIVSTNAIGCAFFSDVPAPGTYVVSVNQPGYVDADPEDGTQLGSEDVTVADRETTQVAFTYDRAASLNLALFSPQGGSALDGVPVVAEANAATAFTRFSGYGTGGATGRTIGGLFPYSGGWTAWAGCEHNDPILYGGTRLGLNPAPGGTAPSGAPGAVTAGTLRLRIDRVDATRSNQMLYATDQVAASGSPCAGRIAVGQFSAAGTFQRDVILPFGDWRLSVGMSAGYLNGDPSLANPPGLIQVRPARIATYTEPLALSLYLSAVLADGPFLYHRLGETPMHESSAADSSGNNRTGEYQSGVTKGFASFSATAGEAVYLDGTTNAYIATPTTLTSPNTLTLEIWFRTATVGYSTGGQLAGFGAARIGGQTQLYDRQLWMADTGELVFGVYPDPAIVEVRSTARYNDAQWHHAVATLGPGGMALYVDGTRVGLDTGTTYGDDYTGYMRAGYDNLAGWPSAPTYYAFLGYVDEFAVYTTELSQTRVTAHWNARAGSAYPGTVTADAPHLYYRFNPRVAGSTSAADSSGNNRLGEFRPGTVGGVGSALLNDANTAVRLNGTADGAVQNLAQTASPANFSIELWLRANAANGGGRLVGFGNALTGTSATTRSDRHLYMRNDGRLVFGVYRTTTNRRTIASTASYADGRWHHVVATFGPGTTMRLYVDGAELPIANTNQVATVNYTGYWRVGADTLSGWANQPTNTGFNGDVDEVAVYTSVLSAQRVAAHYAASGRP